MTGPLRALVDATTLDPREEDRRRLAAWVADLRVAGFARAGSPFGPAVVRAGENALGTPYQAFTLEAYIRDGGEPGDVEPLTLWLTRFDCVSLVESCIAIARVARRGEPPTWTAFGQEVERLRYRGGRRGDYATRLHYFSEWVHDNARRGGLLDLGQELGGVRDDRPLRFMTGHPDAYPAMADPAMRERVADMERSLDGRSRWVVPTERIPAIAPRLETGDVLAFATSIPGLDVTHSAFAYRDGDAVRVLHAPLSGGVVEVTRASLSDYVRGLRRATGILVARPLDRT